MSRKASISTSKTRRMMKKLKVKAQPSTDLFTATVFPEPKPDPEEAKETDILGDKSSDDDYAIEEARESLNPDTYPHLKYPPPKINAVFRKMWRELLPSIVSRENFSTALLHNLEVLCDLYAEYDELKKFIRINGYTYQAFGRQGKQLKPYPQVNQMNRVLGEIRSYSKMLGLVLDRDRGAPKTDEGWG